MRSAVAALAFAMACGRLDFESRAIRDAAPADAAAACGALACLDPAFGGGGVFTLSVDGVTNGSYGDQAVAVQPDGRIVIAGKAGTAASSTALVARVDDSGVLDPSFGSGGLVELAAGSAEAIAIAVAADGSIAVGGAASGAGLVAELDATGRSVFVSEPTFGGGTVVAINGVAIDAAGRVIAGGQARFTTFDLVAGAWLGGGSADPAFAALHYDGGAGDEFGALAGIAPDGGLDLVGQTYDGSVFDGLILHLTNEGTFDPSFGSGGIAELHVGPDARFLSLAREADARIVVTGELDVGSGVTQALVERFSAAGAVDPAWSTTSIAIHPDDVGRGIVQLPDGRVVVGVRGGSASTLVVLDDAGGAMIGTYELPIATSPNGIEDLVLDHEGRLLVLGDAGSDAAEIYLARVLIP